MKNQYEKAPAGAFQQMKSTIEEIEEDIRVLEEGGHLESAEMRRKLEKLRVQFAALSGERLDDK
ncbi:hypothetical protein C2L64_45360 [Paraburkholderia hospita]|uniref:Uncharacterized protein n=1 Tax=Paraburkholderia hospita TaxID=169430 RepID=A0AAN1MQP7_9BURK|nr:hypothetical protein [Paraburkholderia hospita]AUT75596.1 hypothetical protein C2L64_45360 [Paraburkholderia hospita]